MSTSKGRGTRAPPAKKEGESPIDVVQIDGVALMQIIKHCREEAEGGFVAQGVLLGLLADNILEITSSYPFPHVNDVDVLNDYQTEMMRNLRKVNIDNFNVGWYQSTMNGSFLSTNLLDSQVTYQMSIEESIVLVYDPDKAARGFLSLKAYRLSPAALQFFNDMDFAPETQKKKKISFENVLQEIKVVLRNSVLVNALMMEIEELAEKDGVANDSLMDLGTSCVLENHLHQLMDSVDELSQEVNKYNIYQRHVVRQAQLKAQLLQKRMAENDLRRQRGEEPLGDDDLNKMFLKPIVPPSRREPLIAAGQVAEYSSQIANFAAQALGKLFVSESIQKTRMEEEELAGGQTASAAATTTA